MCRPCEGLLLEWFVVNIDETFVAKKTRSSDTKRNEGWEPEGCICLGFSFFVCVNSVSIIPTSVHRPSTAPQTHARASHDCTPQLKCWTLICFVRIRAAIRCASTLASRFGRVSARWIFPRVRAFRGCSAADALDASRRLERRATSIDAKKRWETDWNNIARVAMRFIVA